MKEVSSDPVSFTPADELEGVTRRQFIGSLGATAAGAVALGAIVPTVDASASLSAQKTAEQVVDEAARFTAEQAIGGSLFYQQRALAAYKVREGAARDNLLPLPPLSFDRPNNGDEALYPNRIGSYSKALAHKPNGEVVPSAYNSMLDALRTGNPAAFENIQMGGTVKLTSPQAGYAFDMEGSDAFRMVQPPAPAFASRELAAEISENYWMALLPATCRSRIMDQTR